MAGQEESCSIGLLDGGFERRSIVGRRLPKARATRGPVQSLGHAHVCGPSIDRCRGIVRMVVGSVEDVRDRIWTSVDRALHGDKDVGEPFIVSKRREKVSVE